MLNKNYPHNIIVYEPNWLGDILFTTPSLKAIKDYFPNSKLSCIVPKQYEDLLLSQPYIDQVIAQNDRSLFEKISLLKKIKKEKPDMAFLFHRSKTRARLLKWAGLKQIFGYNTNRRSHLLQTAISEPKNPTHKMSYWKHLLDELQIASPSQSQQTYEFSFKQKDMALETPYLVFHPGANWSPKRWPTKQYASLARKFKDYQIVITGSSHEGQLAQEIQSQINFKIHDLTGKTSYTDLSNIFSKAKFVVAGDTGAMHLACASKANVIALFGPTSPILNGPKTTQDVKIIWEKSRCQTYPCLDESCDHNAILSKLSAEKVYEQMRLS